MTEQRDDREPVLDIQVSVEGSPGSAANGLRWDMVLLPSQRKSIIIHFRDFEFAILVCHHVSSPGVYLESAKLNGDEHLVHGSVPIELYLQDYLDGKPDFVATPEDDGCAPDPIGGATLEFELHNETKEHIRVVLSLNGRFRKLTQ